MPPSTTPSRAILVHRRELISRKQPHAGITGEKSYAAGGRDRMIVSGRICLLRSSRNFTVRRPAATHYRAGNEESAIGWLLPAGAIAIGYFLLLAPETFRSVTGDMGDTNLGCKPAGRFRPKAPYLHAPTPQEVEFGHAQGQADTSLRWIVRCRCGSRRIPLLAGQCRSGEQEPRFVSFPASRIECECPTGEGSGAQCRLLGMLHQDGRRPRSVYPLADSARCERLFWWN